MNHPAQDFSEHEDENLKEWAASVSCDDTPRFELLYNGQPIFLDLTTLLQCLKIAEHCHLTPPIDSDWWLDIVRRYRVEVNLDGRVQTERE
ncbi:hypothetical protein [Vibrio chagasii]|uniref:hypothetical protein n=1 Tax=Vibrio chagasii TaxID=170679 RepID=UPI00228469BF|nr:hypothetical protein [Vibrio chagasii]MCY9828817.1 hypothetical protein [Vibrio chagasii]